MPEEQPEVTGKGYGVEVRAKGYRTLDLAWILVGLMVMYFGLEARANHLEMKSLAERQIQSNTLLACIVSRSDSDKSNEFASENSWCNRMSRGMR